MNLSTYFNYNNGNITYGLTDELIAFYVLELYKKENKNIIFVTSNVYESNKFFNSFKTYTDDCVLFPMDDFITSAVLAMSPEFKLGRLNTLEKISKKNQIIVTNLMGYLKYLPNKFEANIITLNKDTDIDRNELLDNISKFGYKRETLVTTTGEFSVRGFIVDIYIVNELHPIRIEFFGNTIESLRYFDENTQRTIEELDSITIKPFDEIETSSKSSLYDYTNNGIVVYLNKEQINVAYEKLEYIFIDDPVSSLDENHLIELAVNLGNLTKKSNGIKFIISTHNPLFFNVLFNETGNKLCYMLHKNEDGTYDLQKKDGDSNKGFSYHHYLIQTLQDAVESNNIQKYHFMLLRNLYEKTANFLGYPQWSDLLPDDKKTYYNRIIQFTSHSTLSNEVVPEPTEPEKNTLKLLLKHLVDNNYYTEE